MSTQPLMTNSEMIKDYIVASESYIKESNLDKTAGTELRNREHEEREYEKTTEEQPIDSAMENS